MTNFRPSGFQTIPPVIKNLIIINSLVWLAQLTFAKTGSFSMENWFALHDVHSVYFRPYQLITYLFLHDPTSIFHLLFNMFALWMFGSILENVWGGKRFLIFYILCGLGSAVLHLLILYHEMTPLMNELHLYPLDQQQEIIYSPGFPVNESTIGASGAVFGCLAAFGYLFPNTEMFIMFIPVPIKAKWLVLGYAGMELYLGVRNSAGDNVAHWAHLGGAIVGLILVIYWNRKNRRNFY